MNGKESKTNIDRAAPLVQYHQHIYARGENYLLCFFLSLNVGEHVLRWKLKLVDCNILANILELSSVIDVDWFIPLWWKSLGFKTFYVNYCWSHCTRKVFCYFNTATGTVTIPIEGQGETTSKWEFCRCLYAFWPDWWRQIENLQSKWIYTQPNRSGYPTIEWSIRKILVAQIIMLPT